MSADARVLVTGGAGYIGSHAVLALRDAGIGVAVIDNLSTGRRSAVPDDVPFFCGDVGDGDLIRRIVAAEKIATLMHFAGSIVVSESVADPLAYYANNTLASHALINACVSTGIRTFIFSSTAAVYGMPPTLPIDEDSPLKPINPYGSSKMMTEMILRDVSAAHDFRYVALRYFNVAGADALGRAGQSGTKATHLIKLACQSAVGSRPQITIYGDDYPTPDGTCVRDYIHVTDLADAHVSALRYLQNGGTSIALNCGYGRGYSVREALQAVEAAAGRPLRVVVGPRRPGDPPALVAAADRIMRTLAWKPRHSGLETIVRSALAWERQSLSRAQLPAAPAVLASRSYATRVV
jgi:UDP-glucose 4-epimerase